MDHGAERAPGAEDGPADASSEAGDPGHEVEGVAGDSPAGRARGATLSGIIGLLLAIIGLRFGIDPIHDNSFFTHLATGRLILDTHHIPTADPYSFTAHGDPWTVQSWGASVIYALIDRTVGLMGIRLLVGLICAAVALLSWRLTSRAVGLVGRLLIVVPVMAVGAGFWVERPLIFSLLFLLAVLFAIEDRLDPRWLVPIMWIWVNVHGSFVYGLVAIGAYGLGRLLDRERPTVELRAFGWAALGTLIGGIINPIGYRILIFPVQLLQRREAFEAVAEWKPPTWASWSERAFAIQLVLAIVLIVLRGRRWRNIVPVVLFGALALQSSRNIVHASLILIPAMAAAAHGLGMLDGLEPRRVLRPVRAALVVLFAFAVLSGVFLTPDTNLQDYPVASVGWMRAHHLLDRDDRVVTRDFVGNYLELRYGPEKVQVYNDDRVDMYPIDHIKEYVALVRPHGDYGTILGHARASAVLWDTDTDLADWLADPANGWTIVHREPGWIVAVPPGSTDTD